jgi:hypothetical protein
MLTLADAKTVRLEKDACSEPCLIGMYGNVRVDGDRFGVAVQARNRRRYKSAKNKLLSFCILAQDGDNEGVFRLPTLPTKEQAKVIRSVLGLRKKREYTDEGMKARRASMERARRCLLRNSHAASKIDDLVATGMKGQPS